MAANLGWSTLGNARSTSVAASRGAGIPGPALAARAAGEHRVDPPDLVSIYAERLRAGIDAPPLFTPGPVVRIGRGTPAFRRHRPVARAGRISSPRRSARRGRLVAAAAAVAAVITTALAGTVLAG